MVSFFMLTTSAQADPNLPTWANNEAADHCGLQLRSVSDSVRSLWFSLIIMGFSDMWAAKTG